MDPEIPRWQIAAMVLVLVATSAGIELYSSTLPGPSCLADGSSRACPVGHGNLSYASEQVTIPATGSGFGPLTNVSFHGVQFRLWPEFQSPWDISLQGTATEPGGVHLAFVVFASNVSFGGNPPPTNLSVRTWFSPDGVFGVTWVGELGRNIDVRLMVADPALSYVDANVTLSSTLLTASAGVSQAIIFHDVEFDFQFVGWGSPAGPSLNASAFEPNGEIVPLGMWAGPLVACGVVGDTPYGILGNATCLENGAPDHSVALVWDGYLSVRLMVRVG